VCCAVNADFTAAKAELTEANRRYLREQSEHEDTRARLDAALMERASALRLNAEHELVLESSRADVAVWKRRCELADQGAHCAGENSPDVDFCRTSMRKKDRRCRVRV
jgi:hypothetical protein